MPSWHTYADVAESPIRITRKLYVNEPFGIELSETVYDPDATAIDLCQPVLQ
jgi:hypothetical protein